MSDTLQMHDVGESIFVIGKSRLNAAESDIIQFNPLTNTQIKIGSIPYRLFDTFTVLRGELK